MKVLIAIALLSVVSALPRPGISDIDFRPLIVPNEIIEAAKALNEPQQDSGIVVNFVDNAEENVAASEDAGAKVNFVDNAEENAAAIEDAGLIVNIVENAEESVPALEDAGIKVNFVESPISEVVDNSGITVNFVDSPVETVETLAKDMESTDVIAERLDDGVAVNFVNSPVETLADDGLAVNFIDSAPDAVVDADGTAVHFVDSPINEIPQDSLLAINFVNLPLNTNAGAILIIGNVYEPISASELETVRVVDMPMPTEEIRSPGKVFENPLLR